MTLLLGTRDGLYVAPDGDVRGADRVLSVPVNRLRRFAGPGVLAATDDGVYRSVGGREWTSLGDVGVPVHAVEATPDGRIYAGTRRRVFATDDGATWRELADLREAVGERSSAAADDRSPSDPVVRTLATDPTRTGHVLAGLDPGGVVASEDAGESWTLSRRFDGVHHLLAVSTPLGVPGFGGGDGYVASTGDGLYLSSDAGDTWQRLGGDCPGGCNEAVVHEGTLFAATADRNGPAVLALDLDAIRSRDAARSRDAVRSTARRIDPRGRSGEVVSGFGTRMGRLLAGTARAGVGAGRVLVRNPDGTWTALGETPAGVTSVVGI